MKCLIAYILTKCIFIFNDNHKKITNNNKKGNKLNNGKVHAINEYFFNHELKILQIYNISNY